MIAAMTSDLRLNQMSFFTVVTTAMAIATTNRIAAIWIAASNPATTPTQTVHADVGFCHQRSTTQTNPTPSAIIHE